MILHIYVKCIVKIVMSRVKRREMFLHQPHMRRPDTSCQPDTDRDTDTVYQNAQS